MQTGARGTFGTAKAAAARGRFGRAVAGAVSAVALGTVSVAFEHPMVNLALCLAPVATWGHKNGVIFLRGAGRMVLPLLQEIGCCNLSKPGLMIQIGVV